MVAAGVLILGAPIARADTVGALSETPRFDDVTRVGVHNAYETVRYPHVVDALDAGAGLIEIDVWTNRAGFGWRVSHQNPIGNDNNCTGGSGFVASSGSASGAGDLGSCLDDLRHWHDSNPGHRPVMVKLEMKDGFAAGAGRGPADLDRLIWDRLGDSVFGPAALIGESATLDEAVRSRHWPEGADTTGRFLIELIPGTVETTVPINPLVSDVEYAQHLQTLHHTGHLEQAAAFPAVHGFDRDDARVRRFGADLAGWFVIFDGDASGLMNGDSSWYRNNGYLVVATDAYAVDPAIDVVSPTPEQATARVALLAAHSASIVSSDWVGLPHVMTMELPRG